MKHHHSSGKYRLLKRVIMMCLTLILVCSMSISAFAVDHVGRAENGTTQSVQMTDNQKGEAAATRQKSSEAKTKEENTKKSDSESKTKDSSEEQKTDSKDTDNKEAKEKSTEKDAKEDSEKNTSKEEKNSEKNSEETTDASEATTKAAEEKTTEAATEKTTEGKDSKEAASKEKAAEETQAGNDTKAVNDTTAYTLYCYTLIPGKTTGSTGSPDAIWNGMGTGTISGLGAPSDYNNQTIVDDGYGSSGATITYPTSYPDITADGTTYKYAAPGSGNTDKEGYYTITWFRVIRSDGANGGKNNKNPIVNSGTATYHLDGYITLNEKNIFTVGFKLKDAGSNSFEWVDPEKYTQRVDEGTPGSKLKIPTTEESTKYPNIKEKNGIKYRFDGWYLDENCTNKVTFDTYSINNNVTFYGKYVPLTTNITVTKKVTGNMGDKQKAFTFECIYSSCDANGNEKQNQKASFNLKDGETSEIKDVYIGSQFTVEETNAEGYTTSGSYKADISVDVTNGTNKESSTKKAKVKIEEDGKNITITNNKEAISDTGITLDSLPFITLLALSIAGGIFYLLSRYKKRFI